LRKITGTKVKYDLSFIYLYNHSRHAKRSLVAEIFSDCGRKKAGIPLNVWKSNDMNDMMTMEILQLMYQKGVTQLDFL
jgi:hypothetical protein